VSSITISRLSYTSGRAIAHNVATALGYELADQEVFQSASSAWGIPEAKLLRAFQEAPAFFGMSASTRKRLIPLVSAELAAKLLKDDVVYHGPFGHVLVTGVSHVLKVRIFAQLEDRVANRVKRESGLSTAEAERAILHADRQRLQLAKEVFNVDDEDAAPFDLVINTSQVDVDTASDIITGTVKLKRYQPMTYSVRCMENLELSLRARAHLVDLDPNVLVEADNGNVRIRSRGGGWSARKKATEMRQRTAVLEGVTSVDVEMVEDTLGRMAMR
jgi:cytidylate kinase